MENNCDYITLVCNAIVHWYTLIEKMHECIDAYKE